MKTMTRMISRGIDPMQKFWARLTPEDQSEFIMLRNNFLQNAKFASKDRRVVAFRNELIIALRYIEKSPDNIEMRSIMTGLSFCGPMIAVNNRQFKLFTGRCKSSINGSFQQLGYGAVKTKAKAKVYVIDLLPSLSTEPQLLRQWTVRIATDTAPVCFISCRKNISIPSILETDIFEELKQATGNSDPSSCEGSPLQQKPDIPHVELGAHKPQQVHFQLNPPTISNFYQQQPISQQQQFTQQQTIQPNYTAQNQLYQPTQHQNSVHFQMQVPSQISPISCTYLSNQDDQFNDDSEMEHSGPLPSMSTSYSVDNFDEDDGTNDFFDEFWCGSSSIRKSKSEMFQPPVWQDDILADLF